MTRRIEVLNGEPGLELDGASVEACLLKLDQFVEFTVPVGSIEVAFVDTQTCCQLHEDFFGDPDPTDVMTFPGDPEDEHAGDIAVCPAIAAIAAGEIKLPFNEELTLYLVHAWLHLAGLDDNNAEARARMRSAEVLLMGRLRTSGKLIQCSWNP